MVGGQCISVKSLCFDDFFYVDGKCVSVLCGNYDSQSAECLSCINSAYYLSNGTCLIVNCGTGKYWSVVSAGCIDIPAGCTSIDLINQICVNCMNGYIKTLGTCVSAT